MLNILYYTFIIRLKGGSVKHKMFKNILFTMSVSGSVIILIYILIYPIAKRYFPLKWRYLVLKGAIFFYLFPLSEFKFIILKILYRFFPLLQENILRKTSNIDNTYVILVNDEWIQLASKVKYIWLTMACFGIVSIIIIMKQVLKYWQVRKICLHYSTESFTDELKEQFHKIKEDLDIKKNVRFVCSEYCKTPITIGIFSPVVIFPETKVEIENSLYGYMIEHELIHIKHKDLLVKFFGLLVMAIHWYNPVGYILYYELCTMSELACDNDVVSKLDQCERRDYSNLILILTTENTFNNTRFSVGLINKDTITLKRRILEMKKVGKKKLLLSCVIMALTCMVGTGTAFAYNPPVTIDIGEEDFSQNYSFISDANIENEFEDMPYDYFFIDENGNTYDMVRKDVGNRAICDHQFTESGTVQSHNKKSDGSCEVVYREGWRCLLCGYVKLGSVIKTVTYPKCPH